MTSSTYTSVAIVLGDTDTGSKVDMLAERAAECGTAIAETHTFDTEEAISHHDLSEVDAVVTALCRAIRTRSNIWVPFPLDLVREQHLRRISLVLQRHGLNLLVGKNLWACPLDSGINEVDMALRREVRAVGDLDRAAIAAAGVQTLSDEIESALLEDSGRPPSLALHHAAPLSDMLQQLEVQYGPHPGLPTTTAVWPVRQPALKSFVGWLIHRCGMTQAEASDFLNAWGYRTRTGRHWQQSTVSTLVNGRYDRRRDRSRRNECPGADR